MKIMLGVGLVWLAVLDQSVGIILSELNWSKYKYHIKLFPRTNIYHNYMIYEPLVFMSKIFF